MDRKNFIEDRETIFGWIRDFVKNYKEAHKTATSWKTPVCGVAGANDPLYPQLKSIVGEWHLLPADVLPTAKSVVVFFIPFTEDIVRSNIAGEESSIEWDNAYLETNKMIAELVDDVCIKIQGLRFNASKINASFDYDPERDGDDISRLVSSWSHRSSAFIAGIGKFGINNMIITEQGCCGRIGSFVTELELPPTPREEGEYCLYKLSGSCAECIKRCPCGALQIRNGAGFYDKLRCKNQIYNGLIRTLPLGVADTCGKCKVDLPCSFKNPARSMDEQP